MPNMSEHREIHVKILLRFNSHETSISMKKAMLTTCSEMAKERNVSVYAVSASASSMEITVEVPPNIQPKVTT